MGKGSAYQEKLREGQAGEGRWAGERRGSSGKRKKKSNSEEYLAFQMKRSGKVAKCGPW